MGQQGKNTVPGGTTLALISAKTVRIVNAPLRAEI